MLLLFCIKFNSISVMSVIEIFLKGNSQDLCGCV